MVVASVMFVACTTASVLFPEVTSEYASWLNSQQPYTVPNHPQPPVFKSKEEVMILRRVEGSMLGLACGDAMGAFFEFKSPDTIQDIEAKLGSSMREMKGGWDFLRSHGIMGTFKGLKKGAWTDDTSMALCLASSLLVAGRHDPYDQLVRYYRWVHEGYLSSTGNCFDVGAGTKISVDTFKEKMQHARASGMTEKEARVAVDWRCGPENGAGNGCLVRLAPVAIFFSRDVEEVIRYSGESAGTTHDTVHMKMVLDACRYFGALIACAVRGYSKERLLSGSICNEFRGLRDLCDEVREIARNPHKRKHISWECRTSKNGYALTSLEAALWAFANDGGSFEKGVMDIIRLGYDTDTIAAIYGQLAGACYGVDGIPADWVSDLKHADFIRCMGAHLYCAGAKTLVPSESAGKHE